MLIISGVIIITALSGEFRGESFLSTVGMIALPTVLGAWWIREWKRDKRKSTEPNGYEGEKEKAVMDSEWAAAARVFFAGALIAYYVLKGMGRKELAYG